MAFLSHSIPWHTLSDMFEYGDGSNPGPQHPELFAKSKPNQHKQLEYFARMFQATVREHSGVERKRYRSAKDYATRAQTWVESIQNDHVAVRNLPLEAATEDRGIDQDTLRKRNAELRQISSESWQSTSLERRLVFPSDFATTYMSYVPITSGSSYGREGIVEEFAHIEAWVDFYRNTHFSACITDERNRLWLDEKSCSDILRLLLIDSATTVDSERRTHNLETIFLIAHHPQVGIKPFISDGMDCCNIEVGLTSLVEKVTTVFVYLNLLWTFIDGNPSSPLLQLCEHVEKYEPSYCRDSRFISLVPRPTYMNMKSFNRMLEVVLKEHGHVVEHVFFTPLFAPYASGRCSRYLNLRHESTITKMVNTEDMRHERDVFANLPVLREALKSMWKILTYCDIVFDDIEQSINWSYVVIDQLDVLFRGTSGLEKILGKSWVEYELERPRDKGIGFLGGKNAEDGDSHITP